MDFNRDWKNHKPIKVYELDNDLKIWVYQWSRWEKPELDILVKYREKNKRLRTPKHIHWVIDLLIKKEHNKKLTMEFIKFLNSYYDKIYRFKNKWEQKKCEIKYITKWKLKKFEELNNYGEYDIYFIWYLIELFIRMEKNHPNPHVFKDLMDALIKEDDIFRIVSKATQNWK